MPSLKLSEREKNLIVVVVGLLVFYVIFQFMLSPKWEDIERVSDRLKTARLEARVAENKIKALEAARGPIGMIKKEGKSNEQKALQAFKDISAATARAGLRLESIRPMPQAETDRFKFLLVGGGSFASIHDFSVILSRLPVLVLMDDITVTGGGDTSPALRAVINLSAYF